MYAVPALLQVAYWVVAYWVVASEHAGSIWLVRYDRLFARRVERAVGCLQVASRVIGSMVRLHRTIDTSRRFPGSLEVGKFFGVLASPPLRPRR